MLSINAAEGLFPTSFFIKSTYLVDFLPDRLFSPEVEPQGQIPSWYLTAMRISQKGLYALQALTVLARHYPNDVVKTRDIAKEESLPEKFLEAILRDLKRARFVNSIRGAGGGYLLKRPPDQIFLGEVIRSVDGPLAPIEDAESLRYRVKTDQRHRALFRVLLEVRDATARILDRTSLADLCR
jgi:Rrf2 family protein